MIYRYKEVHPERNSEEEKIQPMPTFLIITNKHKVTSCSEMDNDVDSLHTTIHIDERGNGTIKIPAQNEDRALYFANMHLYIHRKGVATEKSTS
jgi:hypothetical protein